MSQIKPRRSAFSVYAEVKPEHPESQTKVVDTTHLIHTENKNRKKAKLNFIHQKENPGLVSKDHANKQKLSKRGAKKLKKTLNKLPSKTVVECISTFKSTATNNTNNERKLFHSTPFQLPARLVSKKQQKPIDEELAVEESEAFDSRQEAVKLFKKVIFPVKVKEFFSSYWEKKPMLVRRQDPVYNEAWFSCKEFDTILRQHNLEFTTNIDVTTYVNEVKQNHNQEGRAFAPLVWDFFQQGCSIRLLNPQTYSKNCWQYLSTLQELFGTCVGANVYLTPAGTQGFAPHYDDIEAFVLQLEGKKRWRVYKPINKMETLPQFSSRNFEQAEIGEPLIDCVLEPGDLLYFPRGYIHQAEACDDVHSLHITVSCYQKNSWGDFLAKLLPGAIELAQQEDIEFRRGLPINYLLHNGVAYDGNAEPTVDRQNFFDKTVKLMKKLVNYMPLDAAVDQMGKQFIHDSLPPCLNESERARSIHGNGEKWNAKKMRVENIAEIEPDTAIKLIRRNCVRLCIEENACLIYHNLENGRVYHEKEVQYLEVEPEAEPAITFLINNYPKYCTVEDLPLATMDEKIVVASCLYDKGLLVTGEPLHYNDSDSDSDEGSASEEEEEGEEGSDEEEVNESNAELVYSFDNGAEFTDEGSEEDEGDEEDCGEFNSEEYDEDASEEVDEESG